MLHPGDQIDIWVIDKRLGSGGMGSVYRCYNKDAHRILAAVKILESNVSASADAKRRFIREAEILFSLEHPNIVKVRNIRVEPPTPYIEMEFVQGLSIEKYLATNGAFSLKEALPLFSQMASAIGYLHASGVRHRDIKPANLLVTSDGSLKLVDFGLAMEADASRLTQDNMSFGTVSYAPPEWVDPANLNPVLWDLYATGVVFWEMLTGGVAFPTSGQGSARQQAFQVISQKQHHPPLDPGPEFPDPVREVVRRLTEANPAARTQSADELIALLRKIDQVSIPTPVARPHRVKLEALREQARPQRDTFSFDAALPVTPPAEQGNLAPTMQPTGSLPTDPELSIDPSPRESSPPARAPRQAFVLPLLLGLAGAAALGLVGVGYLSTTGQPTPRPVALQIQGLDATVPVDALVDGQPIRSREGQKLFFSEMLPGEHTVTWALGDACSATDCPGEKCPTYCATGESAIQVEAGDGQAEVTLALQRPPVRSAQLSVKDRPKGTEVSMSVAGVAGSLSDNILTIPKIPPGLYRARIVSGDCPDSPEACGDQCPAGCVDVDQSFVVPVGEGLHEVVLEVAFPVASPTKSSPQVRAITTPAPSPSGTKSSKPSIGKLVTNRQFASWVAKQPRWSPSAAKAADRVGPEYLSNWVDDRPVPAELNMPVQSVTFSAAARYCRSRGGVIPQVSDPPTTWKESGIAFEFRLDGENRRVLEANGTVGRSPGLKQAPFLTGFRCKRP